VEAAVTDSLQTCLATGEAKELKFDSIDDSTAWSVGLSCGGAIRLWLQPNPHRFPAWAAMAEAVSERRAGAMLIALEDRTDWEWVDAPAPCESRFVLPVTPPVRMMIVGAGHLGVALTSLAKAAGFEVVVIDPRSALADPERFPVQPDEIVREWPQKAFERLGGAPSDSVVVVTHDPKLDDPALEWALRSDVGYIGALGSSKTQAARRERLRADGFSEEQIARIHGPVGLAIGAKTPEEIAISILAQIVQVRRCK
jgi:xanthine dehydrogenase accessory factor